METLILSDQESLIYAPDTMGWNTSNWVLIRIFLGSLVGSDGKESPCNAGDPGTIPAWGRSLGEESGNTLQYFLPGKFHGQRSLVGYSTWDCKEFSMTEQLALSFQFRICYFLLVGWTTIPTTVILKVVTFIICDSSVSLILINNDEKFVDSLVLNRKESACNAGGPSLIPGSGRSSGEGIGYPLQYSWASLVAQAVKNLPSMQETWVQSLV